MASGFGDLRYLAGASMRRVWRGGLRGLREVWQAAITGRELPPLHSVAVWPPVQTGTELADLSARLNWYVPEDCAIAIPVTDPDIEPEPVDWFHEANQQVPDHATLNSSPDFPKGHDAILEWKHQQRLGAQTRSPAGARLVTVDPGFRGVTELSNYGRVSRAAANPGTVTALRARSGDTFAQMLARFGGSRRVAVFGTGPTMRDVTPDELDADVVIACNSAVRDPDWIKLWNPQLIVFGDPVFHFGPSRYAAAFRDDLRKAVDIADSYLAIPGDYLPLLERHMPDLGDRVIGVEAVRTGSFLTPSLSRLAVARTANILTYLMLPFAAALGMEIAVAGCDGRDRGEDYFWRHNKEGQYSDELMQSAQQAHPAFFHDRDYARYYDEHCELLATQIAAIEEQGKRVTSVTTSHIPALRDRSSLAGGSR